MEFPPRDLWTTRDVVGDPGETISVCWNASLGARLRDEFEDHTPPLYQAEKDLEKEEAAKVQEVARLHKVSKIARTDKLGSD